MGTMYTGGNHTLSMAKLVSIAQKAVKAVTVKQGATVSVPALGKSPNQIWGEIIRNVPTLQYGLAVFHEDIKDKTYLPVSGVTVALQADGCSLAPNVNNNFNLSSVLLEPCSYSLVDRICLLDFEKLFDGQGIWRQMGGANNIYWQQAVQNEYVRLVGGTLMEQMEAAFWSGDTLVPDTGSNFNIWNCDGIIKKVINDPAVPASQITLGAALTAANILTEMQTFYNSLPDAVLEKRSRDYYIIMSFADLRLLNNAYFNSTGYFQGAGNIVAGVSRNNGELILENNTLFYQGIPVYGTSAIAKNTIFFSYVENIHWGTDLLSDYTMMRIIPEFETQAGSRSIGIDGRYKQGNAYAHPQYCAVRYT